MPSAVDAGVKSGEEPFTAQVIDSLAISSLAGVPYSPLGRKALSCKFTHFCIPDRKLVAVRLKYSLPAGGQHNAALSKGGSSGPGESVGKGAAYPDPEMLDDIPDDKRSLFGRYFASKGG
ncbi:hypothetical protein BaRGS_00035774 [Batillaria attramentaria]|uniref:Uncharacterized protein n=1 Tax=Batillaria attramentaria TaxID=370345 RepID=A0ABD0JDR5_9CAEN